MLYMMVGHKNDMFFVCSKKDGQDRFVITKVFYNKDKCLQYLERQNRYRDPNSTIG